MIKKSLFLAFGLVAAFSQSAFAQDRYRERPPVVVSSDLSAPWVMQLGGSQARPVVYPRQAAQPRVVYRQRRGIFDSGTAAQPVSMRPAPIRSRLEPQWLPQIVRYDTTEKPGTIVIDTNNRFLYLVMDNGQARRYGVGVGKPGFEWAGEHKITRKAEWPEWNPPSEMISREAAKGHYLPAKMEGGPENPLGARAMYLGSTLYRIHGTNAPWTIGSAVSSGCIRLRNEDVTDLYGRVNVGTRVIVQ
ncbi:L,D-transpeptidase [Neorhizobium lilium]|uniref:L,D-transpeptidase n=1 Tax=Neorhizobium lilium TaxID=2503024 RepID=A0A444LFZ0_9HYPH|nr:L,D-transpeptidase [Neorhizobium lilium]RWX77108.1 L,D-transpeptidase [Neorhizobium lilium]